MVVVQKLKETEITEQDSLLLTRNLLRIAIFNISYIRGLFPEKYFNDKTVPALDTKIKKLMPMDAESRRLIDWMEKGVYDALQKRYLRTLLFCVCETIEGPMLEEYTFNFSYSNSDGEEVSMNVNCSGNKKQGGIFKYNSSNEITPNQMRSSACKMVRTLIQLMRTLDKMPDERTILMKLLYYDDVTPTDYEPPFFRSCTREEANNSWTRNPLKMDIGNVNSKHLVLALKVKSVLDPCEDEHDGIQEDDVSLGADSVTHNHSNSDSETSQSEDHQYIIAPANRKQASEDEAMVDEDGTQDPVRDEQQLAWIKDWISSHHPDRFELNDILSNFPDISVVLIEEIMDKLVQEGSLSKHGTDSYKINKQKKFDYEFTAVKDELDCQAALTGSKAQQGMVEDHMYMKALYHALPMNYISISKLQSRLDGEVNQTTARKLIDKMTRDGYVEAKSNRRLGKRVIHSDLTAKKLSEVKKALNSVSMMDLNMIESQNKSTHPRLQIIASNQRDLSTCGNLHSFGSDLTRTKGRSGTFQIGSIRTDQTMSKMREQGNSPISRAQPIASRESFAPGLENGRVDRCVDSDTVMSCRTTQDKHSRKASLVRDPILQFLKRQKSQAA